MKLLLSFCGILGVVFLGLAGTVVSDDLSSAQAPAAGPALEVEYELKTGVETPAKQVLAGTGRSVRPSPSPPVKEPKVLTAKPGKVDWHDDFEAACRVARDSGKPVLLFQLMGRLDEVFC